MPTQPEALTSSLRSQLRGTQSLVHTLGDCWSRPSLLAIEVLWRWVFGIPALWLVYRQAMRIITAAPLESTGILQLSFQDPWKAIVVLGDTASVLMPLFSHAALWMLPLLGIAWAIASGVGRAFVFHRFDPSFPVRPLPLIVLQLLRLVALLAVIGSWYYGVHLAASATLNGPDEPNLLAYFALVICLSLGVFTAWSLLSWIFFIAPLLVMLERISPAASLLRSMRLGREFTGKLVEVNLVMGIIKLALLVLAMVFSATPLPFESVVTTETLHQWWIVVTLLYFVANDFFQVARLVSFLQFWSAFRPARSGAIQVHQH